MYISFLNYLISSSNQPIIDIQLSCLGASVKADEEEFVKVLKKRAEDNEGKVKVTSVAKVESEIKVEEIVSLHDVIEGLKEQFPKLTHNRIPICNSAAPLEADFDTLCDALLGTNVNCPVIVNCQVLVSFGIKSRMFNDPDKCNPFEIFLKHVSSYNFKSLDLHS